ncbi:MAG: GNAT family N-acetyltransferase [Desulfosarcinaceae bacterium]|nr:GNAT family N-acetyltransferase [Desulfosarcinaceae bacterium]
MNRGNIIIRRARHGDLDALVNLLQALFSLEVDFTPDPARQRRGLALFLDGCGKHRCLMVAERAGEVVAMASIQTLLSTAEGGPVGLVEDVVVAEFHRGQGIGRDLMAALEDWARRHGLTRLQLLADRSNRAGRDFYTRRGWQTTQLICLRKHPAHRSAVSEGS